MKLVVLDGYTLNPGDLDWADLESIGECRIYDRTPPHQVVERIGDAQIVLTNKALLPAEVIHQLPAVRYIGVLATGYNVVDINAAGERGIIVTNVPAYSTPSVAQLTFALLLELTHHVGHHSQSVRHGKWATNADFCYWERPLVELSGLTMGILGLGAIGSAVARIAQAMDMRVIAHSRSGRTFEGVQAVSLDELFTETDVLTLHAPLTDQTHHIVNAQRLATMKPTAFLLNTSRGPLIDEPALADALNNGRLAGAGLDVLSVEPPHADNPLLSARNCYITPHFAWATRAARQRLLDQAIVNIQAFITGSPINVVN